MLAAVHRSVERRMNHSHLQSNMNVAKIGTKKMLRRATAVINIVHIFSHVVCGRNVFL